MKAVSADYMKTTKIIQKIARIWSLMIISLTLIILVAEIMETKLNPDINASYPWYENLIPLLMFLGVVGLGLGWKWEGFGSLLTIISLLATYVMYVAFGGSGRGLLVVPLILLPLIIPAFLFLISWQRTRRAINPDPV